MDNGKEEIVEQPHSVELSMNAKGLVSGKCKCYAKTPEEALTKATEILVKIEEIINEKNNLVGK